MHCAAWTWLNDQREFAIDAEATFSDPSAVVWYQEITVPFAPETPTGGINERGFFRSCWYRRSVEVPAIGPEERLVLHFGAVDTTATDWLDGGLFGTHEGGYTPVQFQIGDIGRA